MELLPEQSEGVVGPLGLNLSLSLLKRFYGEPSDLADMDRVL